MTTEQIVSHKRKVKQLSLSCNACYICRMRAVQNSQKLQKLHNYKLNL